MTRKTQAKINLDAIKANYLLANKYAAESKNLAVIKANAYGHGSVRVARALEPMVPAFAVAIFEEAIILRNAGITKPILILQGINNQTELEFAVINDIWTMIINEQQAALITEQALKLPIKVWLKLDTGMHRLGMSNNHLLRIYEGLKSCTWVNNDMVLASHLPCASDITNALTPQQLNQFKQTAQQLNLATSIANSAALLAYPESRLTWNRPGIMLYGLSPFDETHSVEVLLKPAMTFTSSVIDIRGINKGDSVGYNSEFIATKPTTIATIGAGYADGYPRQAINGTPLSIAGQRARLAGQISMDMMTADISNCRGIKIGDEVELWGNTINANEVAQLAGTIGYDLVTGVSQRVPRCYSG